MKSDILFISTLLLKGGCCVQKGDTGLEQAHKTTPTYYVSQLPRDMEPVMLSHCQPYPCLCNKKLQLNDDLNIEVAHCYTPKGQN